MNAMLSIFCLVAAVLSSVHSAPYLNYYYNTPYNYAAYRNALYAGLAHLYPSAAAAPVVAAAPAAAVVPAATPVVPAAAAAVAPAAAVLPAAALTGAPVTPLDAYAAAMRYLQYGYGYGYGYPYTAPYTYPYYKKK
ncbi:cuticle protein 16.5-like [Uloborus diversus]|uniref:cuticle protein 16.5-like n=1 Tax=Uloborus diversus TaxID=327109 RepID=UPI002409BC51|nr:cuticle protein 16.5-like [Uloborus diversus]